MHSFSFYSNESSCLEIAFTNSKTSLSSVTDCYDLDQVYPNSGYADSQYYYGNGLLHYHQQNFCDSNGVCDDVTVCKIMDQGEEKYYLPRNPLSSMSNARHGTDVSGETLYDAYRLVQQEDGVFIKLNDATFTRSRDYGTGWRGITLGPNAAAAGFTQPFLPLTFALTCSTMSVSSYADLRGTNLKFLPDLRYDSGGAFAYAASGDFEEGFTELSLNDQYLRVVIFSNGDCAHTYFRYRETMTQNDGSDEFGDHLLPVIF